MVTGQVDRDRGKRKDNAESRRAAILNAARLVFGRKGFAATGIDDIAEAAGIAKGTVYLYFTSKDEIYVEALLERAREVEAISRARILAAPSWKEKIRAYMETRLEYLSANQDFFRIYATEFRNMCMRGKAMDVEVQDLIREGERQISQVLAAAIARNEVRAVDPDLAAVMISDLMRGLIDRRLLGFQRSPGNEDLEFTLDSIYRALSNG